MAMLDSPYNKKAHTRTVWAFQKFRSISARLGHADVFVQRFVAFQFGQADRQDAFLVFGGDRFGLDLVVQFELLPEIARLEFKARPAAKLIPFVLRLVVDGDDQQIALELDLKVGLLVAGGVEADQVLIVELFDVDRRIAPIGQLMFPVLAAFVAPMMVSSPMGMKMISSTHDDCFFDDLGKSLFGNLL